MHLDHCIALFKHILKESKIVVWYYAPYIFRWNLVCACFLITSRVCGRGNVFVMSVCVSVRVSVCMCVCVSVCSGYNF